jgi:hypothetical protein
MRKHGGRRRGLVRVTLALASVLIAAALLGTRLGSLTAGVRTTHVSLSVSLWRASVVLSHYATPDPLRAGTGLFARLSPPEPDAGPNPKRWRASGVFAWRWKRPGSGPGAFSTRLVLPLWPAAALVGLGWAGVVWRGLARGARRRSDLCVACGYPRTGLPAGALCPECAARAAPVSAPS